METTLSIPIPSPSTFDPFAQTLLWFGLDSTTTTQTITATEVEMSSLSTFWYQNMHLGLLYGAQLGLTSLMLTTLLLLTLPSKRRATIFLLNVAALLLDLVRSALLAVWLTGMWNHPVVQFLHDYSHLSRGDFATSVAVNVVKTLELGIVLSSLLMQIRVILSTTPPLHRGTILSLAFILAILTLCVQLAATVVNSRNIVLLTTWVEFGLQERLADLSRILQLVSTGFFLAVFVTKLGVAIRQRVKLGLRQFGPMQMVFIGSLQSMLIPVIFTAAQWSASGDFGSLSLTILAVQLPLTALWASTPFQPPHHYQQPQHQNQGNANQQQRPLAMGPGFSCELEKNLVAGSVPESLGKRKALESIPMTTTVGSLDVEVKMDERDMV